jgi:hypothetical protein
MLLMYGRSLATIAPFPWGAPTLPALRTLGAFGVGVVTLAAHAQRTTNGSVESPLGKHCQFGDNKREPQL